MAANALNVSQPAASKTIRELEDILGKTLFDRSTRRLTLTAAGRVFQQHTGAAMVQLGRAQDLVKDAPGQRTKLAVGALPTSATSLMPEAALAFRKAHPNCLLRVTTGPNWLLMSQLREGSLDLVVGRMGSPETMAQLSFHQLYTEPISLLSRPAHPILSEPDPMDHLLEYPLVLPPPGAVISPVVRALLSRYGISYTAAAFETLSLPFGRRLLRDSDALWFISQGVAEEELASGALVEVPLRDEIVGAPAGISLRSDGVLTEEQRGMVAALESACVARVQNGNPI